MKKQIVIAAFACVLVGLMLITSSIAQAQDGNGFTVPLSDPAKRGKLKIHINYGSITVKGTARKDVQVKYTSAKDEENKDRNQSKDGLRRIGGGGLNLEASENNNTVKVGSESWNNKLSLEVEVPSDFDLEVSTYNDGDLVISNIQGELELTNYNGEIAALNISGSVVATTYNGDIKITFDKVKEGTPMSYSTYNGDIDLTLPSTIKATFKMKTEQGDIYTGFDVNIVSSGAVEKKDVKNNSFKLTVDEWRKADINGGGAEFTLKNYNGDIFLRKK